MFFGKNPWQSHGFPRRAAILQGDRQRPGPHADRHRSAPHRDGRSRRHPPAVRARAATPSARRAARRAGRGGPARPTRCSPSTPTGSTSCSPRSRAVDIADVRASVPASTEDDWCAQRARRSARATGGVSIFEDLGIQQAPHTTLNSYLEKLRRAAHRQLRRAGRDEPPHPASPRCAAEAATAVGEAPVTPVGGHRLITGLVPVQRDPRRDPRPITPSGSGRCSSSRATRCTRSPTASACARRCDALELRRGDRRRADRDGPRGRLRAARRVAVREVGVHVLQPRVPAQRVPAAPRRCSIRCRARCPSPRSTPGCARARRATPTTTSRRCTPRPREGRAAYADAFLTLGDRATGARPSSRRVLLYETLGPTLPRPTACRRRCGRDLGARAALRDGYPDSIRRAGIGGRRSSRSARRCSTRSSLARRASRSPSTTTTRPCGASRRPTARCHLVIPELLAELDALRRRRRCRRPLTSSRSCCRPASGDRRPRTRSSATRRGARRTPQGALRVSVDDAARLGLADGDRARVTTKRGTRRRDGRGHRHDAARPHQPAERLRPRSGRVERRRRRRAERADRVRGPRLVRRHAAPQARPRPRGDRSRRL